MSFIFGGGGGAAAENLVRDSAKYSERHQVSLKIALIPSCQVSCSTSCITRYSSCTSYWFRTVRLLKRAKQCRCTNVASRITGLQTSFRCTSSNINQFFNPFDQFVSDEVRRQVACT